MILKMLNWGLLMQLIIERRKEWLGATCNALDTFSQPYPAIT